MREHYCDSEELFLASLTRCRPWRITGGQRGVFYKVRGSTVAAGSSLDCA